MSFYKSELFWAIVSIVLGLFLFIVGCSEEVNKYQYLGAFLIAVGIFISDYTLSERKKIK